SIVLRSVMIAFAALLVTSSAMAAQGQPSTPPTVSTMAPAAREYLSAALDTLQRASMHDTANWSLIRDSAFIVAAGAEKPRDTYAAIQWALKRVDRHSFLQASRG